ncbi:MAG: hypothetical protein AB7U71_05920 [Comamonas sp.]
MTQRATLAAYMHVEGFDNFHRDAFDKRKLRAAFRKVGRLVEVRSQLNLSLAGGSVNYPRIRKGVLRSSIQTKVSRSGFMVKIMPQRVAGMSAYYPAYLHYGVTRSAWLAGRSKKGGSPRKRKSESKDTQWHIRARGNYVADALEDEAGRVRAVLSAGFAAALR